MAELTITETFPVPMDRLWQLVRKFDDPAIAPWLADSCESSGGTEGSDRIIQIAEGVRVQQRLERLDEDAHRLTIRTTDVEGLPCSDVLTNVTVQGESAGTSTLEWNVTYTPEADDDMVRALLRDLALTVAQTLRGQLEESS